MPFTHRALDLARLAAGGVSPRPPVGAVIVRDGRSVGEGWTQPRPGPHAEVAAIQAAGAACRGATMYVSLEPHAHHGVAPPCTDAIIAAGISSVVCPIEDPNPQVSGNGFRQLRAAGIEVTVGGPAEDVRAAEELVEGFAKWITTKGPFVIAKFAMSLDGKIATSSGDSQWITGEQARQEAHRLRATADAVMVGIGTVLRDDPRLTARGDQTPDGRPRLRVIVDTHGRMPSTARLLAERGDVLWVQGHGAPGVADAAHASAAGSARTSEHHGDGKPAARLETVRLPASARGVDLDAVLRLLGQRDVCTLMVEGGGTLLGILFDLGLVDKVAAFIAPVVIGGKDAPGPVAGAGVGRIAQALRLEHVRHRVLGDDILVTGYVTRRTA